MEPAFCVETFGQDCLKHLVDPRLDTKVLNKINFGTRVHFTPKLQACVVMNQVRIQGGLSQVERKLFASFELLINLTKTLHKPPSFNILHLS